MTQFLNDKEKLNFFSKLSNLDLSYFPHETTYKTYVGAEFVCFTWYHGRPKIITVFITTGISAGDRRGIEIQCMDKRTYKFNHVTNQPNRLINQDFLAYVPYRCQIERTVKVTGKGKGKHMSGMAAGLTIRMRSSPAKRVEGHTYVVPYTQIEHFITQEQFKKALKEIEYG